MMNMLFSWKVKNEYGNGVDNQYSAQANGERDEIRRICSIFDAMRDNNPKMLKDVMLSLGTSVFIFNHSTDRWETVTNNKVKIATQKFEWGDGTTFYKAFFRGNHSDLEKLELIYDSIPDEDEYLHLIKPVMEAFGCEIEEKRLINQ